MTTEEKIIFFADFVRTRMVDNERKAKLKPPVTEREKAFYLGGANESELLLNAFRETFKEELK